MGISRIQFSMRLFFCEEWQYDFHYVIFPREKKSPSGELKILKTLGKKSDGLFFPGQTQILHLDSQFCQPVYIGISALWLNNK